MVAPGTGNGAMAAALAPDAIALHLYEIEHELGFVLTSLKMHPDIQAKIAQVGFGDLRMFSEIDEGAGKVGVRAFAKDTLGINSSGGAEPRAAVARLCLAWETARKRVTTKIEAEAQQRVGDGPKVILKQDYANSVKALNDRRGVQTENLQSSQGYLESRLDQVEDGIYVAEMWSEVTTIEEDKSVGQGELRLSRDGRWSTSRGSRHAPVPSDPESLRTRIKVMAHHWELIRIRFPHMPMVKDYDFSTTWLVHVEWLLGEKVRGYKVKSATQQNEYSVPWAVVLELDYQIRKAALFAVTHSGASLASALETARKTESLLQQHFWIPLGIAAAEAAGGRSSRVSAPRDDTASARSQGQFNSNDGQRGKKAEKKGKGGKNGKGGKPANSPPQSNRGGQGKWGSGGAEGYAKQEHVKAEAARPSLYTPGPTRRRKCIAYQKDECKDPKCPFVHVCFNCNKKHPQSECRIPGF